MDMPLGEYLAQHVPDQQAEPPWNALSPREQAQWLMNEAADVTVLEEKDPYMLRAIACLLMSIDDRLGAMQGPARRPSFLETAQDADDSGELWPHVGDKVQLQDGALGTIKDVQTRQNVRIATIQLTEGTHILSSVSQLQPAPTARLDVGTKVNRTAVDQIVELQQELADLRHTKKAELRREIDALRFKCNCPYNTDFSCLDRDTECPTHGDEAFNTKLAGEKALNTLKYVRKYFMGSEHGHEV